MSGLAPKLELRVEMPTATISVRIPNTRLKRSLFRRAGTTYMRTIMTSPRINTGSSGRVTRTSSETRIFRISGCTVQYAAKMGSAMTVPTSTWLVRIMPVFASTMESAVTGSGSSRSVSLEK